MLKQNKLNDAKLLILLGDDYLPKWYKKNNNYRKNISLSDYMYIYLYEIHKKEIRYNTFLSYERCINKYIIPCLGNIKLKELSPNDIKEFYKVLIINDISLSNIKHINRVLSAALNRACILMYISINPMDYISLSDIKDLEYKKDLLKDNDNKTNVNKITIISKKKKRKKDVKRFLTLDETKLFLNELKDMCFNNNNDNNDNTNNEIYYLPTYLTLMLGLRRGEMLALKYSDVNFKTHEINISKSINRFDKRYILSVPKTKNSIRVIHTSKKVCDEILYIKNKYKRLDSDFISLNNLYIKSDLNNLIDTYKWLTFVNKITKKLNIGHIRLHDLRHTNASLMINNNVPMKVASTRLGHSSITTTLDIYSHVDNKNQIEISNKIDKLFVEVMNSNE